MNLAYKGKRATECRQIILDYLNKYGASTAAQLSNGLGYEKRTVLNYLKIMRDEKEITSQDVMIGKCSQMYHAALVKVTANNKRESVKPKFNVEPWRTVHRGTEADHPIPNQRGQGALRKTVHVSSSAVFND